MSLKLGALASDPLKPRLALNDTLATAAREWLTHRHSGSTKTIAWLKQQYDLDHQ